MLMGLVLFTGLNYLGQRLSFSRRRGRKSVTARTDEFKAKEVHPVEFSIGADRGPVRDESCVQSDRQPHEGQTR